jgi:O-antigen ligase
MDIFIHCTLALALMHAGYTERQLLFIAAMIIAGALIGLWFGTLEYATGITRSLGFHSAGVTTQSSIYLGIVIVLILGLLADKSVSGLPKTILLLVSAYLLTIGLVYMGSRGALLAVVLSSGLLLVMERNFRFLVMTITVALLAGGTATYLLKEYPSNMNQQEYRERLSLERFKKSDNERLENWHIAIARIKQGSEPILGIGPKNYSSIDPGELGITSSFYARTGEMHHAHNLFLTRWVEQGLAGITAILLFYLLVAYRLWKSWPYCRQHCTWIWAGGLGALLVPMIAGFFNTPFYQEHAMLAMLLLGSMLGKTQAS